MKEKTLEHRLTRVETHINWLMKLVSLDTLLIIVAILKLFSGGSA